MSVSEVRRLSVLQIDADELMSSSRVFLEDTLRQCESKLAEQEAVLASFIRDKERQIEAYRAATVAEIERFRRVVEAETAATKAVVDAIRQQIKRQPHIDEPASFHQETLSSNRQTSSRSQLIVQLATAMLEQGRRPVRRQEIVERVFACDVDLPSTDIEGLVSKALARSGKFQVVKRRYWFAGEPFPGDEAGT
ncbi:hypothetical protein [Rhizobium mayense]|uniref:HTH HARE-type domain-containing protein n=1 Tax=Rhizobium mayense TaxID=1312184 RepID=A0ABT7K3L9_9HYPH|nr:hypothetical protein [Rhizobium mayense]MDL2403206.1 hypothetical protein [Rhizobium mayense]